MYHRVIVTVLSERALILADYRTRRIDSEEGSNQASSIDPVSS